ncbi:MAG: hypothetical protein V9G20_13470 [Candidatus Promineifilaceae bacterium]
MTEPLKAPAPDLEKNAQRAVRLRRKGSAITRPLQDATTKLAGQTQSLALETNEGALQEKGLEVKPLAIASATLLGRTEIPG